jgi:hypothetical protein
VTRRRPLRDAFLVGVASGVLAAALTLALDYLSTR